MPRAITVKIGGETHSIDLDDKLHIHDADAERHSVAADMAWWGAIAAAAEAQVERLTAVAASWRASALTECLKHDEKMSEWKAKAAVDASPDYLKMQTDIANAREQAAKAQTAHWSLVRKMDMLKEMIKGEVGDKRNSGEIGRPALTEPVALPRQNDPRLNTYRNKRTTKEE